MADPNLNKRLITWAALLVLPVVGYLFVGCETYCVLYPGIDTRYAAGYSERAFEKVVVGMTQADVRELLGEPLHGHTFRNGKTQWSYTSDGKCRWADWAWLGREIVFRDGRVTERVARVYYD